jgi:hypothetical protein
MGVACVLGCALGDWKDAVTVTCGWKQNEQPWKRPPRGPKQQVMTQNQLLQLPVRSKLLRRLVDLVGIEPTTSSMPGNPYQQIRQLTTAQKTVF